MRPPHALTVNAADPLGADGAAADLKTFTALGVYGSAVLTSLGGSASRTAVSPEVVRSQLGEVLAAARPDAIKVGEAGTAAHATVIAEVLREAAPRHLIVDAVMVSGDDQPRISAEGAVALRTHLLPLASVLVANLMEAAQLLGSEPAQTVDGLAEQAGALREHGAAAVLLTGARLGGEGTVDVLAHAGGVDLLRGTRVDRAGTRGAGATLSAAITAQYARLAEFDRAGELAEIGEKGERDDDLTIIASAQEFLASALANASEWNLMRGENTRGPLNHLITLDQDSAG